MLKLTAKKINNDHFSLKIFASLDLCKYLHLFLGTTHAETFFFQSKHKLCRGYSKEPSQCDGSFEHPKQLFKLMGKKIMTIFHSKYLPDWTYVNTDTFFLDTHMQTLFFFFFSTKTYVVGAQKNCLNETVLMSTQKIRLN